MEVLDFEKMKSGLHATLLSRIDLEKLSAVDDGKARRAVATVIQEIVGSQRVPLNATEKRELKMICSTKCSVWVHWSRFCAIPVSPTFS